ncbi:hypothetical protein Belba_0145 [Belliella baltica DSM 15883]|uniref:Lipoprotein n=1 Tax=Belliella baltica (strain DSM 15883 / CIP 108006 / LMG 21964 / BA134) TaxID=866536 RepID=I3Z0P8_BELBD|nr:hypothetical protein [Belliella baltica]AFL82816.1 hypothetical protein Belba_0145 [Belliella baltica DSM 15883]
MKNQIFILLAAFFIYSCTNDIERNITTNLQAEANEIFQTSLALEESLSYVFLSFEDYQDAQTDTLPGCPTILIDEIDKKVELQFTVNSNCPSQKLNRSGNLVLDFNTINLIDQEVLLSYDNYKIKAFEIIGNRRFTKSASISSSNLWQENFMDLLIVDEFQNSTKISGSYDHRLEIINDTLISFTSSGNLEGRNITGRPLKMTQITPRLYQNVCIEEGQVIASSGVETWEIFRTPTRSLAHTLTFSSDSACVSKASLQLSDGRLIVFEQ